MTVHKHSKLITQFARMVEAGHPIDNLVQVKGNLLGMVVWLPANFDVWREDEEYRVALAFIEGKPVFKGDILYHKSPNGEYNEFIVEASKDKLMLSGKAEFLNGSNDWAISLDGLTWNNPQSVVLPNLMTLDGRPVHQGDRLYSKRLDCFVTIVGITNRLTFIVRQDGNDTLVDEVPHLDISWNKPEEKKELTPHEQMAHEVVQSLRNYADVLENDYKLLASYQSEKHIEPRFKIMINATVWDGKGGKLSISTEK